MEIPTDLKELYNHWQFHTDLPHLKKASSSKTNHQVENDMLNFASERMKIWKNKSTGSNQPFTKDKILTKYRFCNIYRELDKQTVEIHKLLKPLTKDLDLWLLNMLYCRLVCNTKTIKETGLLNFNNQNNIRVFTKLRNLPRPKYGIAYIFPVSVIMKSRYPTREEFFCFYLPKVIKRIAKEIESFDKESVVDALVKIIPIFGYNLKFHWTEVLIDLAYQYPQYINLFKRFPIGPGSAPTMKILAGGLDPEITCLNIMTDQPFKNFSYLTFSGQKIYLSAENIEGIGCEFRKYTNLKNGFGRKRIYNP